MATSANYDPSSGYTSAGFDYPLYQSDNFPSNYSQNGGSGENPGNVIAAIEQILGGVFKLMGYSNGGDGDGMQPGGDGMQPGGYGMQPGGDGMQPDGCSQGQRLDSNGMNEQGAAGVLSSYMSQNNIKAMTPDKLYELATNPPPGTPPEVSRAADYMLKHPKEYEDIETHDVAGADGKAGVNDMQWAAEGSPIQTETLSGMTEG